LKTTKKMKSETTKGVVHIQSTLIIQFKKGISWLSAGLKVNTPLFKTAETAARQSMDQV
jgi:hypothetical protein